MSKQKDDKVDLTSVDDKVGLNNLPKATLFEDVSLMLGEKQIEGGQMCHPYLDYFSTVMQFQPPAQRTHMTTTGWYKDKTDKFYDVTNKGFVKRMEMIKDSQIGVLS